MKIEDMTLKDKIAQMLCFAFHGTELNDQLKTLIVDHHIGNIIYFARNVKDVTQVQKLNQIIKQHATYPLWIGLDQEGGMVRRIEEGITYVPGAMALSAGGKDQIFSIHQVLGEDLHFLGFDIDFAPVGDVNNNPKNPVINSRSFSDDPNVVAKCCVDAALGLQAGGILPTIKHFPGHGDTSVDSHVGLPVVKKTKEELERCEFVPFASAIQHQVDGIMISHILYEKIDATYPSSLSCSVITDVLKNQLGFKGLIITDSLTMGAIWNKYSIEEIIELGVNAGNDILMFCGKADLNEQLQIIHAFQKLVEEEKITIERINTSVSKILMLKEKYQNQFKEKEKDSKRIKYFQKLAQNLTIASITKVKGTNLLPLKQNDSVLILFPKIRLTTLVDNANNTIETLNKYLNYEEIIIEQDEKTLENIVQNQSKYDKILFVTYNVKENDFQTKIYSLLEKEKVIVIALRSPYDINELPGCHDYICTYDITKESLQALAVCLKTNQFNTKLPIQLEKEEKKEND